MSSLARLRAWLWRRVGRAPVWQKLAGVIVTPVVVVLAAGWGLDARFDGTAGWPHGALLAIAGLVGVGMSALLGLALTRPLRDLTSAMERIEAGELAVRVPIWADDEIGELERVFNHVAESLEASRRDLLARNHELAFLNRLAVDLAHGGETPAVVRSLLSHVVETFGADEGAVYRPEGETITVHRLGDETVLTWDDVAATPVEHVLLAGTSLTLGDVVPGHVPGLEAGPAAWLAAPLAVHGTVLGAVAVARRSGSFTREERDLLDAAGNVAGIGLHNLDLLADLADSRQRLRRALARSVEAQEEERRRLARELHDETSQSLTSMLLRIKALEGETDLGVITDRLTGLRYLTSLTLGEVRRLSTDLRPVMLDDLGLVPAIRVLAERVATESGIEITLCAEALDRPLDSAIETILYRATQESLTNVVRHSGASRASVRLERTTGGVRLSVDDDGKGFDPSTPGNGFGLLGMRERAELVGGCFTVEGVRGSGTAVVLDIPFEGRAT